MSLSQSFFGRSCHGEGTVFFASSSISSHCGCCEPVNHLCYAGHQARRRHNIEVLHRAGKSPQEIIQQTGYKTSLKGTFGVDGFDVVKLRQFYISCLFFNALQVYSTVTTLQNGEGIARKAGSGIFPHSSHVGKKTKSKRSLHRTNIPPPIGLPQTEQPGGQVIEARSIRHYLYKDLYYRYGRPQREFLLSDANKNACPTWAVLCLLRHNSVL